MAWMMVVRRLGEQRAYRRTCQLLRFPGEIMQRSGAESVIRGSRYRSLRDQSPRRPEEDFPDALLAGIDWWIPRIFRALAIMPASSWALE